MHFVYMGCDEKSLGFVLVGLHIFKAARLIVVEQCNSCSLQRLSNRACWVLSLRGLTLFQFSCGVLFI